MSTTEIVTAAPAGTWQFDSVHSSVAFEIGYLGGTFKGQFRNVDAALTLEDGQASLTGSAEVASVDVKDENLNAHLQAPDFFDAEQHPELRFAADGISVDGSKVEGRGEITIKGATRPIEVKGTITDAITDPYGNQRVGLQLSAVLDRTDFGVDWNAPLPSGDPALSNAVTVNADLFFVGK
jgi:polyisoprenoid-binding protein YceI